MAEKAAYSIGTCLRALTAGGLIAAMSLLASAQTSSKIPRMPDGKPDLQGMYDLAILTPVERPAGLPAVLTDEQGAKLEKQAVDSARAGSLPIGNILRGARLRETEDVRKTKQQ